MHEEDFRKIAKRAISRYINGNLSPLDRLSIISENDVIVVWECKILQNNKAMFIAKKNPNVYFEFSWNGDKKEGYLDVYHKCRNLIIRL